MPLKRAFVHNADLPSGQALVHELSSAGSAVYGSLSHEAASKPLKLKRVVRRNPETLIKDILSCQLAVFDLHTSEHHEIEWILTKIASENPTDFRLVLISSVLTWAGADNTSANDDEAQRPLTADFFLTRKPHPEFETWKFLETLGLKIPCVHVVACGALYGLGESTDWFREAFEGGYWGDAERLTRLAQNPSDYIPTLHFRDMARAVVHLGEGTPPKYSIMVDTVCSSKKEILKAVANGFGLIEIFPEEADQEPEKDGRQISGDNPDGIAAEKVEQKVEGDPQPDAQVPSPAVPENIFASAWSTVNFRFTCSEFFTGLSLHCPGGLVANISKIISEFYVSRRIEPPRIIILDENDMTQQFATDLSETLRIPVISGFLKAALEKAADLKKKLDEAKKNAKKGVVAVSVPSKEPDPEGEITDHDTTAVLNGAIEEPDEPEEAEEGNVPEEDPALYDEEGDPDHESELPDSFYLSLLNGPTPEAIAKLFALSLSSHPTSKARGFILLGNMRTAQDATAMFVTWSPTAVLAVNSNPSVESYCQAMKIPFSLLPKEAEISRFSVYGIAALETAGISFKAFESRGRVADDPESRKKLFEIREEEKRAEENRKFQKAELERIQKIKDEEERQRIESEAAEHFVSLKAIETREAAALAARSQHLQDFLKKEVMDAVIAGVLEISEKLPEDPVEYLAEFLLVEAMKGDTLSKRDVVPK